MTNKYSVLVVISCLDQEMLTSSNHNIFFGAYEVAGAGDDHSLTGACSFSVLEFSEVQLWGRFVNII